MAAYGKAAFVGLVVLGFCFMYTKMTGEATGLTILNHTLSSGTVFLLSLVLLSGSFTRMFGGVGRFLMSIRREVGMMTFLVGLAHVYLSMFPLARRGPFGFYTGRPWSAYPGLLGLVLMATLFVFSFIFAKRRLPSASWWKLQYQGARIALVGIVVHVVVLRWSSWMKLSETPPLALLACLFALYVGVVKFVERFGGPKARSWVVSATFVFVLVVSFLFIFPRVV